MAQPTQSFEEDILGRDLDGILNLIDAGKPSKHHYDVQSRPSTSYTCEITPSPVPTPEDILPWGVQSPGMYFSAQNSLISGGLETGYLDQMGVWHRVLEPSFNFWNYGHPVPSYLPFIPERAPAPSHQFYASPYISNVSTPFHISSSRSTSTTSPDLIPPFLLPPPFIPEPPPALTVNARSGDPRLAGYFQDISQTKERELLVEVLNSGWLAANEPEPQYMGKSILIGFLHRETLSSPFLCRFDGCEKTYDRQDRAVAHIRRQHLKYRPYACGGACGKPRCQEKFANLAYRRGHIKKNKGTCVACGKELTRKNLPRHITTCGKTTIPLKRTSNALCMPSQDIQISHSVEPAGTGHDYASG